MIPIVMLLFCLPLIAAEPELTLTTLPRDIKELIALTTIDSIQLTDNCRLAHRKTTDINTLSLTNREFAAMSRDPKFLNRAVEKLAMQEKVLPSVALLGLCLPCGQWRQEQQNYFENNIHELMFLNKYISRNKKSSEGYTNINKLQKPNVITTEIGEKEVLFDVAPVDKKIVILSWGTGSLSILRAYSNTAFPEQIYKLDKNVLLHKIEAQGKSLICDCAHNEYKYALMRISDFASGQFDESFGKDGRIQMGLDGYTMQTLDNGHIQIKAKRGVVTKENPSFLRKLLSRFSYTSDPYVPLKTIEVTVIYDQDGKNIIDHKTNS